MIVFKTTADKNLEVRLTAAHSEFVLRLAKETDTNCAQVIDEALQSWARQTLPFDEYHELFKRERG